MFGPQRLQPSMDKATRDIATTECEKTKRNLQSQGTSSQHPSAWHSPTAPRHPRHLGPAPNANPTTIGRRCRDRSSCRALGVRRPAEKYKYSRGSARMVDVPLREPLAGGVLSTSSSVLRADRSGCGPVAAVGFGCDMTRVWLLVCVARCLPPACRRYGRMQFQQPAAMFCGRTPVSSDVESGGLRSV